MAQQDRRQEGQANLRSIIQQEMAQMQWQGADSTAGQGENSQDKELRQMVREELAALNGRSGSGGGRPTGQQNSMGHRGQATGGSSQSTGQRSTSHQGRGAGGTSSPRDNPSGSTVGSSSNSGSGSQSSASSVGQGTSSHKKKAKVAPKMNANNSQTVAQVLTQAQYELSQELEANLKKLRSVIQQSEEIAKKIELVLGRGEQGSGTKE